MIELLAVGLPYPARHRVPLGTRLHHVPPHEVPVFLDRYGSVIGGALVGSGLPEVQKLLAERAPQIPTAVLASGAMVGLPESADLAVVAWLAQLAGAAAPMPSPQPVVVMNGSEAVAVAAWELVTLGRTGGPLGAAVARSWRATLADVVAQEAPGCGVSLRYVSRDGTLRVGLVTWGRGAEPSEALARLRRLERTLAPLLSPSATDAVQPYAFLRLDGEAAWPLLAPVEPDEAVRLRAPSAEGMIGQIGPFPLEDDAVLENVGGLDQPAAAATSAMGPLARVLRAIDGAVCVEVSIEPAPLSASEREVALTFVHAARDETSPPVRRAAARAAQLAIEGARALRVRVTVASEATVVPPTAIVEAARALVGDPATVDAVAVDATAEGGVLRFGDAPVAGSLAERAAPDEVAARFALPVPTGRPLWGIPVAPAPAPEGLPEDGVRIGTAADGQVVRLTDDALRRHLYVVGTTGTGKSQFLVHLAARRARTGRAVLVVDPHGDTAARVAREVGDDAVEIDLGDPDQPWRLNPIEVDPAVPNARSILVEALLDLFGQLWDMKDAGGPMFETYFRNAVYLAMSKRDEPGTLRDVWRLFSDDSYRTELLLGCQDREVVRFWTKTASHARGEASLDNIAPYVLSKLTPLVSNDALAHLVAAPRSTLDVGALLDGGACVVVRLDKGRLGSYGARLAGTVLLSRLLLAAMRRPSNAPDALVVVDEFQNFVTPQMAELLAEARKFNVQFALAHQTLAQVPERLLQTVLGNAGNLCVFRPGVHDAARLEPYLAPEFDVERLLALPNYRAACRVLVDGAPSAAFELRSDPPAA